jgi:predicted small metal-binding protein
VFREPFVELSKRLCAYDERVKQIPCVCGQVVRGDDDEELWQNAQAHIRDDHPELVGKVSRADLLAQAEEVPEPS